MVHPMASTLPAQTRASRRRSLTRPAPLPLRFETLEDRSLPSFSFPLNGGDWREFGPRNVAPQPSHTGEPGQGTSSPGGLASSGRISDVVADPNNINVFYVTTAGGGVWKTTDYGETWRPLTDRLPTSTPGLTDDLRTLNMGGIALSPLNPNIVYAGEGEQAGGTLGHGILKSLDGGATWRLITGPDDAFLNSSIPQIIVLPNPAAPTDPTQELVFALVGFSGSGNAGIWRSDDGGETWLKITPLLNTQNGVSTFATLWDMAVDPSNPNIAYVSVGNTFTPVTGIYRTENALSDTPDVVDPPNTPPDQQVGTPWTVVFGGNGGPQVPSGILLGRINFVLAPSSPSTLYVFAGDGPTDGQRGVYRSQDRGTTWREYGTVPTVVPGQSGYNMAIAVDPTNVNRLVLSGLDSVTYTNDALNPNPNAVTWSELNRDAGGEGPHVDHHTITFTAPDQNGQRQLLAGSDGGMFRTRTFEAAASTPAVVDWESANGVPGPLALGTLQFVGIALHPSSADEMIGGTQDNGTLRFFDDGTMMSSLVPGPGGAPVAGDVPEAWAWPMSFGGDGGDLVWDPTDPNNVYTIAPFPSRGRGLGIEVHRRRPDLGRCLQRNRLAGGGPVLPADRRRPVAAGAALRRHRPHLRDHRPRGELARRADQLPAPAGERDRRRTGVRDRRARQRRAPNSPFFGDPTVTAIGIGRSDPYVMYAAVSDRGKGQPGHLLRAGPVPGRRQAGTRPRVGPLDRRVARRHDPANGTCCRRPWAPRTRRVPTASASATTSRTSRWTRSTRTSSTSPPSATRSGVRSTAGSTWTLMSTEGLPTGPQQGPSTTSSWTRTCWASAGRSTTSCTSPPSIGVYTLSDPTQPVADQVWTRVGMTPADPIEDQNAVGFHPDVQVDDLELNTATGLLAAGTHGRGIWQFQIRPYISGIVFDDTDGDGVPGRERQRPGGHRRRRGHPRRPGGRQPDRAGPAVRGGQHLHPGRPGRPADRVLRLPRLEEGTYDITIGFGSRLPVDPGNEFYVSTPPLNPVLDENSTIPTADIGVFRRVSVSGLKFNDRNTNGVQDANEPGLAGWTFELFDSTNPAVTLATAVSDATGAFTFTGVGQARPPAASSASASCPSRAGWRPRRSDLPVPAFTSGQNVTGLLFGNVITGNLLITGWPDPATIAGRRADHVHPHGARPVQQHLHRIPRDGAVHDHRRRGRDHHRQRIGEPAVPGWTTRSPPPTPASTRSPWCSPRPGRRGSPWCRRPTWASTGTSKAITVTAGAASQLRLLGLPASVIAGQVNNVTVTAADQFGNQTNYTGPVSFTGTDPQASLPSGAFPDQRQRGVRRRAADVRRPVDHGQRPRQRADPGVRVHPGGRGGRQPVHPARGAHDGGGRHHVPVHRPVPGRLRQRGDRSGPLHLRRPAGDRPGRTSPSPTPTAGRRRSPRPTGRPASGR